MWVDKIMIPACQLWLIRKSDPETTFVAARKMTPPLCPYTYGFTCLGRALVKGGQQHSAILGGLLVRCNSLFACVGVCVCGCVCTCKHVCV